MKIFAFKNIKNTYINALQANIGKFLINEKNSNLDNFVFLI